MQNPAVNWGIQAFQSTLIGYKAIPCATHIKQESRVAYILLDGLANMNGYAISYSCASRGSVCSLVLQPPGFW